MRDHCTDGLNIVWPWDYCCFQHDEAYLLKEVNRFDSDNAFYQCVAEQGGLWYAILAFIPILIIGGYYRLRRWF